MSPSANSLDPRGGGPPPLTLTERAFELLSQNGPVDASDLIRHVFGTTGAGPWAPILDRVLGADPRFTRDGVGWTLAAPVAATRSSPGALIGLALAATGYDRRRHRVARLSAVRFREGRVTSRFDAVVNPQRRVAGYVAAAARIEQETVEQAPLFGEIAGPLRDFLLDETLAGHGIAWTIGFLNAELARAELPSLTNRTVEVDDLRCERAASGKKPTLRSLAEQLGMSHPRPGFPPADAEVAARVASGLLEPARQRPPSSPIAGGPRVDVDVQRPLLDRSWLADVPLSAGVYTIADRLGAILYVGKAVNLRRRLSAYAGRPFGLNRELEALACRAHRIETIVTPSDLEARLLEARLIGRHEPPFNVARRARPRSLLIRAAPHEPTPRIALAREAGPDGALYLGPYRSETAARAALSLVRAVYPLAGRRRAGDPAGQRGAVQAAVRLLSNQKADAIATLRAAMRDASGRGDRVAVERNRALLRTVLDFEPRPSPLIGVSLLDPLLVVEPANLDGERRAHLIEGGRLRASGDAPPDWDAATRDPSSILSGLTTNGESADDDPNERAIVTQWLGEVGREHTLIAIGPSKRLRD